MKNSFMNLALPLWLFSEPLPPNIMKDKDYDPIVLGPIKAIPSGTYFYILLRIFFLGLNCYQRTNHW
jgi:hypothetical protein